MANKIMTDKIVDYGLEPVSIHSYVDELKEKVNKLEQQNCELNDNVKSLKEEFSDNLYFLEQKQLIKIDRAEHKAICLYCKKLNWLDFVECCSWWEIIKFIFSKKFRVQTIKHVESKCPYDCPYRDCGCMYTGGCRYVL